MLRKIKPNDKLNFTVFAQDNNISIYLFSDFIKNRKLAFISEKNDIINGLIYADKSDDCYLNIITNSNKVANNLLKIFFWNWKKKIFAKIEKSNKLGFILKSNGFRIINKQDNTFLLNYNPKSKGNYYGRSGRNKEM